jgi:sporulation protein YlmC with PRC-barrel domain
MGALRIVHDVLDLQLCDRHQRRMGRVDSVVLELHDGTPPRIARLMVGGTVLAERVHPRLGRWAAALRRRWGTHDASPTRIPWSSVRSIGSMVEVDVDSEATLAMAWEQWLREHLICRIPGAGR